MGAGIRSQNWDRNPVPKWHRKFVDFDKNLLCFEKCPARRPRLGSVEVASSAGSFSAAGQGAGKRGKAERAAAEI